MLTLNDGRSELWQWDTGRTLAVDADCSQVHFSNKFFGRSIDVDVADGVAIIPDVLLQTDKELIAWAFVGTAENGYTKISKVFKVNKRNKPADYVFTPTEQTTLDEIMKRLDRIEEGKDPDAIKNAVDDYLANNPIKIDETDPTVPTWAKQTTKPKYTAKEVEAVATVNGITPDEKGNVQIEVGSGGDVDLTGYATEQYVQGYAQPKGNYLTEVPAGYAKTEDIPTKPEDIGAQPVGDYLTEVPSGYATEEFVKNKIAEAELGGEEVDLSGYAQKSELPTKVSQLQNDSGYLTTVPDGYAKTADIPTKPSDIGAQPEGDYALRSEIPSVPVQSVNGKTGAVKLGAGDVGARPSNWMPTAQEVGALPDTYVPPNQTAAQVGADPAGTAAAAVGAHNASTDSHWDLRLELKAINDRLTAFFDSDNQTLDELSEIVAYITSNNALIDSITTSKVSVADIINNLTTNVANKPLSAAQGVVLKSLIDAVSNSLSNYQPKGDYALRYELPTVPTKVSQLQNDKGYLTEHQDISGKLDADQLPAAVNNALAQAKASGEFDGDPGTPGVTPHIGENGNWYIGSADTGVEAHGKDGTAGRGIASIARTSGNGAAGTTDTYTITYTDNKTSTLTVYNGKNGTNGTSVTVVNVTESTIDGGNNIVKFSDGKTVTIRNGSKGADGKDYVLTEADKAEIAGMVGDIASGGTTTVLEWQDIAVDFSQYPNKYVQWTSGIGTSVKFVDYDTGGKFAVAKIPVSAGDKFKTKGRIFYNAPVWLVAGADNKVVQMGTKGGVVENSEDEFTVAAGGAYLYINKNDQNNNGTGFQYLKKEVETTVEVPMSVYLSPLYNKKIVYDGDSICLGAFGGGGYAKIIANTVMGAYDNQAKGGARLTAKGDNTYHSVVDNLGNLPADGDLYCFEGGINDFWTPKTLGTYSKTDFAGTLDTGTVCGALETIFRYALSNFVGKPICFVITHKIQSTAYVKNANGDTFEDYRNAMVGICQKYSIAYYDAFSESGLNGWNTAQNSAYLTGNTDGTADGCHPNEEGYKRYYVPQLIRLFEGIMPVS